MYAVEYNLGITVCRLAAFANDERCDCRCGCAGIALTKDLPSWVQDITSYHRACTERCAMVIRSTQRSSLTFHQD